VRLPPNVILFQIHHTSDNYNRVDCQYWTESELLWHAFTHSLRRTKATLIYRPTGNFRAVQLLPGHKKIESTVRYLGIKVDDALAKPNRLASDQPRQSGHALPPAKIERVHTD
jgi:integrase